MSLSMPHSPQTDAGFSLIETVAAMGILAMAALPLMQVSSDSVRNTGYLETRLLARTVAENVMAQTLADPDLLEGGISTGENTQMGRRFIWVRTAGLGLQGDVQALEVTVRANNSEQVLARLVGLQAISGPLPLVVEATDEGEP